MEGVTVCTARGRAHGAARARWCAGGSAALALAVAMTVGTLSTTSSAASRASSIATAPVKVAATARGRVAYREIGRGPPLVMIMGFTGTMESWEPIFVDSLARSFRVVVFDNAGLGATTMPSGTLTITTMADQTSALISALHLGRVDVLGYSMGGMIAQSLAVHHPTQLRKLVLCATFPGDGSVDRPAQKLINDLTSGSPRRAFYVLFPSNQQMAFDSQVAQGAAYPASAPASATVVAAQRAASIGWWEGDDPAGHRLASLDLPTLVSDGAVDRLDPVVNDRRVAHLIARSRLVIYPDAGHSFIYQEGTPFVHLVTTFLLGPPPPAATSTIRARYLSDFAAYSNAGRAWGARLTSLGNSSPVAKYLSADLVFAAAYVTFDDSLLNLGATGQLGRLIDHAVGADVRVMTDVLALTGSTSVPGPSWTTAITTDSKGVVTSEDALRAALGIAKLPTTTTTVRSTSSG
ncbi:MAG: alpha/beta fold hydrolase [Acidimicrobiales bacterium]